VVTKGLWKHCPSRCPEPAVIHRLVSDDVDGDRRGHPCDARGC